MKENIVLIDAENLGCNTSVIKNCLSEYNKVFIIFSHLLAKLDFNTIADFSSDIKSERLNIIKMDKIGKNSADFGLAFIAGQLSSTLEKGSTIEIRSKDLMLNNIIGMLNKSGINAKQVLNHPVKMVNKVQEVIASKIDLSDISANNEIEIEPISEAELSEMNCSLLKEITFFDSNNLEQHKNFDILDDLNSPKLLNHENLYNSNSVENNEIEDGSNVVNDVLDATFHDEQVIQQIIQFNSENKITISKKSRRVLVYLISIIKEDKFKRGVTKCICDNFGNEKDIAKIIFNTIYFYGLFTNKVKTRSYQSIMTHLSSIRGLSKHFATVFINYLCACNMVKHNSGRITNMTDLLPIIKALEFVVTDEILLKE